MKNQKPRPKMMHEYHIKKQKENISSVNINPLLIHQTGLGGGGNQFLPYQQANYQAGIVFPTPEKPKEANVILSKLSQVGGVVGGITSAYQTYHQIKEKYGQARQFINRINNGEFDEHLQRFGLRRPNIEIDPSLEQEMNDWESVLGRNSRIGSLIEDDNISNITQSDLESLQGFNTPRVNMADIPDVPDMPVTNITLPVANELPSVPTAPLELPAVSQSAEQAFSTQPLANFRSNANWMSDVLDRERFSVRGINSFRRQASYWRDLFNPEISEEMQPNILTVGRALNQIYQINPNYMIGDNIPLEESMGIRLARPAGQTVRQYLQDIPNRISNRINAGVDSLRTRLSALGDRVTAQSENIQNSLGQAYDSVNFEQMSGGTVPDTLELAGDATAGEAAATAGETGGAIGAEAGEAATAAATAGEAAAGIGAGAEAGEILGEVGLGLLALL